MEAQQNLAPITGREGKEIDIDLAANWTQNYRHKHPGEALSQFFGKEILERILAQPECLGIRFYYAHDKQLNGWQRFTVSVSNFILKVIGNIDGDKHLIIAGAMSDGTDQLKTSGAKAITNDVAPGEMKMGLGDVVVHAVGEMSSPCPGSPGCPSNVLTGK